MMNFEMCFPEENGLPELVCQLCLIRFYRF